MYINMTCNIHLLCWYNIITCSMWCASNIWVDLYWCNLCVRCAGQTSFDESNYLYKANKSAQTTPTILTVPHPAPIVSMTRQVSSDLQWIVVRLSPFFKVDDISIYMGISVRSIYRILQHFRAHGNIPNPIPLRPREPKYHLRDLDVEVWLIVFAGLTWSWR
jgi:hypothetical protein